MKVKFEFEDRHGLTSTVNNQELDMSQEEMMALFNADEIIYPVPYGNGSITSRRATITGKEFDMYTLNNTYLLVKLKEIEIE